MLVDGVGAVLGAVEGVVVMLGLRVDGPVLRGRGALVAGGRGGGGRVYPVCEALGALQGLGHGVRAVGCVAGGLEVH